MSTTNLLVMTIRIDPRDFARLVLYWREQGVQFEDRAELIRTSLQSFLIAKKAREVTSERAIEIISDLVFVKTMRQRVVDRISEEIFQSKVSQIQELTDKKESSEIEKLIENLEEETEE